MLQIVVGGQGANGIGGGGGGGYSGGGGTGSSSLGQGGGGSFLDASFTDVTERAGANSGNGFVSITPVSTAVPEPSSLLLLGLGGVSFAVYGWRRRQPRA